MRLSRETGEGQQVGTWRYLGLSYAAFSFNSRPPLLSSLIMAQQPMVDSSRVQSCPVLPWPSWAFDSTLHSTLITISLPAVALEHISRISKQVPAP